MKIGNAHKMQEVAAYVALFLFYVVAALVIGVDGNFPLNDDWAYGLGVEHFLASGEFRLPGVCAAGFAHVLWGALFAKLAGFSFVVLRVSSLLMSFAGTVAFFWSLRLAGLTRSAALLSSFLYAGNPVYLNVTFSFMSDTTALAFSSLYFALLLRAWRKSSLKYLGLALLSLLLAISVRQSAFVLGAAAVAVLFADFGSLKKRLLILTGFAAAVLLSGWLVDRWLLYLEASGQAIGPLYTGFKLQHVQFFKDFAAQPGQYLINCFSALGQILCYLGLFLLPLLPGCFVSMVARQSCRNNILSLLPSSALIGISAFVSLFQQHRSMPFSENILRFTSVGALGLMGIANNPLSGRQKKWLTAVSYLSAFALTTIFVQITALTARFASRIRRCLQTSYLTILPLCTISTVVALAITLAFLTVATLVRSSDRYYLMALAPALMAVGLLARYLRIKLATPLSVSLAALLVAYSIAGCQDYLASNRARWAGISSLEAKGVSFKQIDGGAEYNVYRGVEIFATKYRGEAPRDTWRWWQVRAEDYIVSFSPIPGYEIVSEHRYFSYLTFSEHIVYVLKQAPN
jgi:hypothetical protein